MSIELLRKRLSADRASFIEPCLPSAADKPPSRANWIYEIKHDGFRLMARRDPVGIRRITRRGNDRRSFTRGTPRGLFGSIGLMAVHSSSVSS